MKKLITICLFITATVNIIAQDRPMSIEDLKGFVGYNKIGIEKKMIKMGFPHYNANEDEKKGPFIYKYFDSEEWGEMKLIINENTVIGAGYDDFSPSEYSNILEYFKIFDWIKTVDEKMIVNVGLERIDLWVSEDKKWKVKVDYQVGFAGMKNTITDITLSSNELRYGFE